MHTVSYPAVSIGAKTNSFELIKNLVEIWSPKSRRGQSKDYKEIKGLHDSSENLNFRKVNLPNRLFIHRWCTLEPFEHFFG